jgi:hypothetical protein
MKCELKSAFFEVFYRVSKKNWILCDDFFIRLTIINLSAKHVVSAKNNFILKVFIELIKNKKNLIGFRFDKNKFYK